MTFNLRMLAKGGIATASLGAMALAGATPVQARDRDDGISIGEVIAGAVIIGGIAAIAGSSNRDRDYYRGDRYYRDGAYYRDGSDYRRHAYRQRGNPRAAVERCVNAASRDARRYGGYRWAQVTQIRDVDDTRYGWRVKGRIEVENRGGRYDRYDRYDRRDRRYSSRSRDAGKFTCYIDRGRVSKVDYSGIRGLR
ncbi:hypothetical protein K3175_02265 [Qipengyuania sp. GH1]|uniref:hypothetical protein n=1 Tax=Qipengyuania aestuarii TaxID=2867241 RepID=UPI001C87CB5D|nr:hypothetical protein [Qipengyuania aestuarii]MBX7534479.1 hypothetical protein [Qipengyuania aestuarii]